MVIRKISQKKEELKDFQSKITEKLNSFANNSKKIIEQNGEGKLVYAGGDDILAFLNLNYLFAVIKNLRFKFPEFEKLGFELNEIDIKSTASCGIVIAHYKAPLSEVLKWTRIMEKEAKSIDNQKDAFAITVLKHSGDICSAKFHWNYEVTNDTFQNSIKIIEYLIKTLENGNFSPAFIKILILNSKNCLIKKKHIEKYPFLEQN